MRHFLNGCLTIALALGGCATVTGPEAYPDKWASIDLTKVHDGCPTLTGTYSDRGTASHPQQLGAPPLLSEVFARMGRRSGRTWPEPTDVKSVQLILEAESLTVRFLSNSGKQTDLPFRRYHFSLGEKRYDDLFTCYASETGSRLRFLAEPESHSGGIPNLYLEGGGTLVFLLRASDGSLIVQWRSDSVAISSVLLGSHIRFNSVWWKYPPLGAGQ